MKKKTKNQAWLKITTLPHMVNKPSMINVGILGTYGKKNPNIVKVTIFSPYGNFPHMGKNQALLKLASLAGMVKQKF